MCICSNFLWKEDILLLEKLTKKVNPYMDQENPIVLIYQKETWELLLQLIDLEEIIEQDRAFFCNEVTQIRNIIVEEGILLVNHKVIGESNEVTPICTIIGKSHKELNEKFIECKTEICEYYKKMK